ncbi:MAG: HIT domain-containing protein, partial [Verrucomicrobiota bacterium]
MQHLWAPWRSEYIQNPVHCGADLFLKMVQENEDEKNHIIARRKSCFAILNAFPYNAGHTMILPYRMVSDLDDLSESEQLEILQLLSEVKKALKACFSPHAFNIGANIGEAAGAGIAAHFHLHVVPRWKNVANFMTAIAEMRVHPKDL